MSLTKTKETYEFSTDAEAVAFIETNKSVDDFILSKYSVQRKVMKRAGTIVYIVTLEKEFSDGE